MPYGDPINTLAQWKIWQIELRVISALIAWGLVGLVILGYFIFGDAIVDYAGYIMFGVPIIMFVGALIYGIKLLVCGPRLDNKLFDPANWPKHHTDD